MDEKEIKLAEEAEVKLTAEAEKEFSKGKDPNEQE
jgi:hypothetical protein